MRIPFPDLSRPKATAKALASLSPRLKLAAAQEVLARQLGYRDWHDLSVSGRSPKPDSAVAGSIMDVILGLSQTLDLDEADVQYTICRTRLLSHRSLSLEEHLRLATSVWRRHLGPPKRGKPGTIVKIKARGNVEAAYLQEWGRPTYLLFDTGPGSCADFEVVTPRIPLSDFIPSRLWLPYGYWILRDGSEVMFSRDYFPLWRATGDTIERVDPWLWIHGIAEERHFTTLTATAAWHSGLARELAMRRLAERRICGLPRLVSVLPYMFKPGVKKPSHGVARLRSARGDTTKLPSYAQLNKRLDRSPGIVLF